MEHLEAHEKASHLSMSWQKKIFKIHHAMAYFEKQKQIAPYMSQGFKKLADAYFKNLKESKRLANFESHGSESIEQSDDLFIGMTDSAMRSIDSTFSNEDVEIKS